MYEYRARVTRIVDGDTIKCDIDLGFDLFLSNQTVRLYGIDAPESRTRDQEEKFYGNLAKQYLKDYCPKGSWITLKTHLDKKGKFGRILGELIVNRVSINELMIQENYAVEYHGQSKLEIDKEHLINRSALTRRGFKYIQ